MGSSPALGLAALLKEAGVGLRFSSEVAGPGTQAGCSLAPGSTGGLPAQQMTASDASLHSHERTLSHKYHHDKDLQLMMDTGLHDLEESWVALEVVNPVHSLEVAHRMPGHPF